MFPLHYSNFLKRKILERIINIATKMEDGEEKKQLVKLILNQMKRSYVQWNKAIDDEKIFEDLRELSGGKLDIKSEDYSIPEIKVTPSRTKLKNIKYQRKR
jgi:hypothetical protein